MLKMNSKASVLTNFVDFKVEPRKMLKQGETKSAGEDVYPKGNDLMDFFQKKPSVILDEVNERLEKEMYIPFLRDVKSFLVREEDDLERIGGYVKKEQKDVLLDTITPEDELDIDENYNERFSQSYGINESLLSTSEIEESIEKLKDLHRAGFIPRKEYINRLVFLETSLKYSKEENVPHSDYRYIGSSTKSHEKNNRNVRVFISSTFLDMQSEREILMKMVFPRLKEFGKERGIVINPVDLRWGITSEETNQGNTITICLNEIDQCSPYFISLIGNRYGWSQPMDPNEPRDKLLKKSFDIATNNPEYKWIRDYSNRSITELEIRHAVLNNLTSERAQKARFYFKNSVQTEDPRLTKLKAEISQNLDLHQNSYNSVEELGEMVYQDLLNQLDMDFPLSEVPTPLQKEKNYHLSFEDSRSGVYIGRQFYFDATDRYVGSKISTPLLITGDSGMGKSAFLCNWSIRYRLTHPHQLLVSHYIGSTSDSTSLANTLKRIISEIQSHWNIQKDIPNETSALIDEFPEWLRIASSEGGIVIVLDAIDQFDDNEYALDMLWIPPSLPKNVKIICSSVPGKFSEITKSRNWKQFKIVPLQKPEIEKLVLNYMDIHRKTLTENQVQLIVEGKNSIYPLFTRTVLDEIRVHGVFESLDEVIKNYINARDISDLFKKVFKRLETDFETPDTRGLVGRLLSVLFVSRKGLSEEEIQTILDISPAQWSPLYVALGELLINKSGYLSFFHDKMKSAVQEQYAPDSNNRRQLYQYFSELTTDRDRYFEESLYQLEMLGETQRLSQIISTIEVFEYLYSNQLFKMDLYRYWRRCVSDYSEPLNNLKSSISNLGNEVQRAEKFSLASKFLNEIGHYKNSEYCARRSLEDARESGNRDVICICLEDLGFVLRLSGRYNEALEYYQEALTIREKITLPTDPKLANAVNGLAILCRLQGKYAQAKELYHRALQMRKDIFGEMHVDVAESLNSLGCLYQDMSQFVVAEGYYNEAIRQRELLLGSNHPDVAMSLNNLGGLYLDWSKYPKALHPYQRARQIYQNVYGYEHPYVAKSINSIAGLYQEQGDYQVAEPLYLECLNLRRKLLGSMHPDLALTLNDIAVLYTRMDNNLQAEKYYIECLSIREKTLGKNHADTAQTMKNLGILYQEMEKYNQAYDLITRSVEIVRQSLGEDHHDYGSALSNLASLLQVMSRYHEAEELYNTAERIFRKTIGKFHADTALLHNDMGVMYSNLGDYNRAEEHYLTALEIYKKVYGDMHLNIADALLNVAQFYANYDTKKSIPFYKEAIAVLKECYGPHHTKTQDAIAELNKIEQ